MSYKSVSQECQAGTLCPHGVAVGRTEAKVKLLALAFDTQDSFDFKDGDVLQVL